MSSLVISTAALVFAVNIITSFLKRYIYPRFGAVGIQIFSFVLAFIGAAYVLYGGNFPKFQELVAAAGVLFSLSVTFYETVLRHFDFFRKSDLNYLRG